MVAVSNTSEPGYDGATITVRGVNTFGKADPLVVVDGVPGRSLERIDPSTIETMSVLKMLQQLFMVLKLPMELF